MGYILDKKTALSVVKSLKKEGERIVLTHGAYDLFHIGHLEFLKKSKEKGDILIVGVESDERIAMYKAIKKKVVIPFDQRLKIISKVIFVDFVVPINDRICDSEYYIKFYDEFTPDHLTYGRAYGAQKTIEMASKALSSISFDNIIHQYDGLQSTTDIKNKISTFNAE